ncbi:OPT oligopeptide transporter protein-domain-containing protein [Ilyonectria robusta]|uniref:OPT oligopeptide transporter protein-domain-containing protein n=1 Tax=Ilyonectria robusta TaxID=1079257 RepID=UPI001E8D3D51|nr:OPT oligopeptide transporter protein-domain-containing protein [Ilyonectria robusta]KAH8654171.1 OPT oligopeptide transporter protein-domain-containing protein [Ilyonectria robusta]
MNTLLETLHRDRRETRNRLRFFWWILIAAFVWEVLPEYVMPILTGISIFCLAKQDSMVFTNIFGGSNGNKGLGILLLGLDWQFISSKPLWTPLATLTNSLAGYIICIFLFLGVYYRNTEILNNENMLQPSALETEGISFFAGTYAMFLFTTNLAITATVSHLLLWNWNDLKTGYSFLSSSSLRQLLSPRSWNLRFWQS